MQYVILIQGTMRAIWCKWIEWEDY